MRLIEVRQRLCLLARSSSSKRIMFIQVNGQSRPQQTSTQYVIWSNPGSESCPEEHSLLRHTTLYWVLQVRCKISWCSSVHLWLSVLCRHCRFWHETTHHSSSGTWSALCQLRSFEKTYRALGEVRPLDSLGSVMILTVCDIQSDWLRGKQSYDRRIARYRVQSQSLAFSQQRFGHVLCQHGRWT